MIGQRNTASVAALVVATLSFACTERPTEPFASPPPPQFGVGRGEDVRAAIAAHQKYSETLHRLNGVVGSAVAIMSTGRVGVKLYVTTPNVPGIPAALDNIPVEVDVTGQFVAWSNPTTRQRPAPNGFSIGHPAITAGTLGAKVINAGGVVYILSNNHVLANSNNAQIGDATLQPGPADGGVNPADAIGTLAAFRPIDFATNGSNTFDGAIALVTNPADVTGSTPLDDCYGAPASAIFGDVNGDGTFDDKTALLGLNVQKCGRTTKLTHGTITGINATVTICYQPVFIFCLQSARFVDQVIITPGGFSDGGDSGSLIVTDDANKKPVALLFAGSPTQTIASRIDLVLNYFGVTVDGTVSPPPSPVTDIAITSITTPAFVEQGTATSVSVIVQNAGNQPVSAAIPVTLTDATASVTIGTQNVNGLAVGGSQTLSFPWTPAAPTGAHTLTANHTFGDDNAANNTRSTTVTVNAPGSATSMHVGDLGRASTRQNSTWTAIVPVRVHDVNHAVLLEFSMTGTWTGNGVSQSATCTANIATDVCIFSLAGIPKKTTSVTLTVTGVTLAGYTYSPANNHDIDGDSNGTSITVNR
jgi:hypothetical protein